MHSRFVLIVPRGLQCSSSFTPWLAFMRFFSYVALSDPGCIKFIHIIEQCPRDWETTIQENVVLTIFHTQNICHRAWKIVRTTLQCIVGLQSWGEGHEKEKNYGTNLSHSFPSFSNLLPAIGEQRIIKVWFWEFSTHGDIYFVCGKLSEQHFDAQLSPNRGDTVL